MVAIAIDSVTVHWIIFFLRNARKNNSFIVSYSRILSEPILFIILKRFQLFFFSQKLKVNNSEQKKRGGWIQKYKKRNKKRILKSDFPWDVFMPHATNWTFLQWFLFHRAIPSHFQHRQLITHQKVIIFFESYLELVMRYEKNIESHCLILTHCHLLRA